ncbi:MAG: SHOCT domain-containing protein [Lactobacillus sp.]|nr:SHOCT domain-containing protein [Lactobacillus sp.]
MRGKKYTKCHAKAASYISSSEIDGLHELKHLLDDDVITRDDFDAKKRQILGL